MTEIDKTPVADSAFVIPDFAALQELDATVHVEPAKGGEGFVVRWKRLTPQVAVRRV